MLPWQVLLGEHAISEAIEAFLDLENTRFLFVCRKEDGSYEAAHTVPVPIEGRGVVVFKAAAVAISNDNLHLISVNDFSPVDPLEQLMTICEEVTTPHQPSRKDQPVDFCFEIPWRKQTDSLCFLPGIWKQNPSIWAGHGGCALPPDIDARGAINTALRAGRALTQEMEVQGYLAHKKHPPPQDQGYVGSYAVVVSYERVPL